MTPKQLDKYYTNKDVALHCINLVRQHCTWKGAWVEPSAGNGVFLQEGMVKEAFDIFPENTNIQQANWFDVEISYEYGLIGNPPFGKRNSLSKDFIRKAVEDKNCKAIAFVLPSVYNKHTLQKVFPSSWSLVYSENLEDNSFTFEGNPYKIPCVFQIWELNGNIDLRAVERKTFSNKDFTICSKEDADLFVFGAAPRKVIYPSEVNNNNRGYYLKSHALTSEELRDKIIKVDWKGNSSANGGVAWLTKTEFMNQYEEKYHDAK